MTNEAGANLIKILGNFYQTKMELLALQKKSDKEMAEATHELIADFSPVWGHLTGKSSIEAQAELIEHIRSAVSSNHFYLN